MQIVFGIDFGTTNSALSVYRNGTVEVFAVDGCQHFAERFGLDKLESRDAFTSVVHGLGASVPLFV